LVRYHVLFAIDIRSRRVEICGVVHDPHGAWMKQVARNLTMADWGFLEGRRYVIFDRDSKYCESFRSILKAAGLTIIRLLSQLGLCSPNSKSCSYLGVQYE